MKAPCQRDYFHAAWRRRIALRQVSSTRRERQPEGNPEEQRTEGAGCRAGPQCQGYKRHLGSDSTPSSLSMFLGRYASAFVAEEKGEASSRGMEVNWIRQGSMDHLPEALGGQSEGLITSLYKQRNESDKGHLWPRGTDPSFGTLLGQYFEL